MTDEPKYMKAINRVTIEHNRHDRSKKCQLRREEKGKWYVRPLKVNLKIIAQCTVCGEAVEEYFI